MFGRKKTLKPIFDYDPSKHRAVLRCSICTGERVAGFKDLQTGHFTDIMLIRNDYELEEFKKLYGLSSVIKEY